MSANRNVLQITTSIRQREGAGFLVRRPFPTIHLEGVDPFLLLDEMGPVDYGPGEAVGAPDHPHRGFETVTYILEGETEHEDSAGHRGILAPGDVQWMTAGRGVVHSEMPSARICAQGGRLHGFQLWVNLPARDKMMPPRYQEIPRARLPEAHTDDGLVHVRILAGKALAKEAVIETCTPILYLDWTVRPGGQVEVEVPVDFRAFVYVFGGALEVGTPAQLVQEGEVALLGDGQAVRLSCPAAQQRPARALVLGGRPLGEPVAWYGPFVMNTRAEILEAIADYQQGRLGRIVR